MTTVELIAEACLEIDVSREILAGKLREQGVKVSVSSLYKWGRGLYKPSPNTERVIRDELTTMIAAAQEARSLDGNPTERPTSPVA